MHRPTTDHWTTVNHRLCYLCGTSDHGLLLYHDSPLSVHAFSDANWAGNKDDSTSTSVYIVYLGCNLISWSLKK